jgi:hypothetical protein
MQHTVYDKLRILKELVSQKLEIKDERKLFKIMARLATWHYPKKRSKDMQLSLDEVKLYEFLISNNYHPSTSYKWMLACNTNEDVQRKLQRGEISLKGALRSAPFKRLNQAQSEMMYQIKLAVKKYVIR